MLYQEKKVTDDDYFFEKENDTKLSNEDRDKCEGKITRKYPSNKRHEEQQKPRFGWYSG